MISPHNTKALEIDPNYTDAWNNRGLVLYNLRRYKEDIEYYDKALEIIPKHANALANRDSALKLLGAEKNQGGREYSNKVSLDGIKLYLQTLYKI